MAHKRTRKIRREQRKRGLNGTMSSPSPEDMKRSTVSANGVRPKLVQVLATIEVIARAEATLGQSTEGSLKPQMGIQCLPAVEPSSGIRSAITPGVAALASEATSMSNPQCASNGMPSPNKPVQALATVPATAPAAAPSRDQASVDSQSTQVNPEPSKRTPCSSVVETPSNIRSIKSPGSGVSASETENSPSPHRVSNVVLSPEKAVNDVMVTDPRPELLVASVCYAGAKNLYMTLAGLPVLSLVAPAVELAAKAIVNMTPLKPSPEEQAEQQTSLQVLDKKICNALAVVDEVVGAKKDDAIEGVRSATRAIKTSSVVQNAEDVANNATNGIGEAYDSANRNVGSTWRQMLDAGRDTYTWSAILAGDTINTAKSWYDTMRCIMGNIAASMVSQVTRMTSATATSSLNTVKVILQPEWVRT